MLSNLKILARLSKNLVATDLSLCVEMEKACYGSKSNWARSRRREGPPRDLCQDSEDLG